MKTIIRKLVPFLLAFAVMFSVGSFARAESTSVYVLIEISSAEELMAVNCNADPATVFVSAE